MVPIFALEKNLRGDRKKKTFTIAANRWRTGKKFNERERRVVKRGNELSIARYLISNQTQKQPGKRSTGYGCTTAVVVPMLFLIVVVRRYVFQN